MSGVYSQLLTVQDRPARVWRGGSGRPLVLLHGELGDAAAHWRWCWPALAPAYSVYAPDLPGLGGMTAALPETSLPALVAWTYALLDTLQLSRVALVGNSFGATLARLVAAEPAGRVTHLVLVNGGALLGRPALAGLPGLGGALGGRSTLTPQSLDKAVADRMRLTAEFAADARRGLAAFAALEGDLGRGGAPRAAAPACASLILWGAQDKVTPVKSAQALAKELPSAKLMLVPNAGRMPQMEQTDVVVAALRDFVPP